jgi:glycine/D-amino acid oxidase-like deaminating enzyme
MHSVATFRELQKGEVKPDWHEVGSLRIALSDRRALEFQELKKAADAAGLEASLISQREAQRRWPLMEFTDVKAVLWCPSDGWMTPVCVAKSYEHVCRRMAVRFALPLRSKECAQERPRCRCEYEPRLVQCRYLINAAGAHAYTSLGWWDWNCPSYRCGTSISSLCR